MLRVRKALESLFAPTSFVGLFPFVFRQEQMLRSKIYLAYTILCCTFSIVVFCIVISNMWAVSVESYISLIIEHMDLIMLLSVQFVALLDLLFGVEDLKVCYSTLKEVDQILQTNWSNVTTFNAILPLWCTFVNYVAVLVAFASGMVSAIKRKNHRQCLLVSCVLPVFYCYSFLQMILLVRRFCGVHRICSKLFASCSFNVMRVSKINPKKLFHEVNRLETLVDAHSRLCFTTELFTASMNRHILVIIAVAFIISTTECFELLSMIMTMKMEKISSVIKKISWVIGCSTLCTQVAGACAESRHKAREFNTLLYQLMIDDKTGELLNNKKLSLHISMKREVLFTACGFFTLDYTLIHSMIASATTYLAILIQFGQASSPPTTAEEPVTSTLPGDIDPATPTGS